ncbi:hypothetical protein GLOTRDRAFT_111359 [Gloeophyllum trabeum ATCC 11539]|uniref:Uncharacterized protein n=1 Tax=Gloeophyllum trabeum (strain ATCC 11539 / FP-39264 / Madison 617) TaxID=670483 RepID=S7Q554_GLOTA|nr:uncharacterized protein GLOTRDRAFT_111359 [Gloeophyllum trabeum ATCC 11539]EPQ54643.1 hypothetical protein GLOTRDRAFT_111359 [Gloeophyllum trabeum ATCC 11539]
MPAVDYVWNGPMMTRSASSQQGKDDVQHRPPSTNQCTWANDILAMTIRTLGDIDAVQTTSAEESAYATDHNPHSWGPLKGPGPHPQRTT